MLLEQLRTARDGRFPFLPDTVIWNSDKCAELWTQLALRPEYYQTWEEIALLEKNGTEIAKHIRPGSVLIDLGPGDTRKVTPLLNHIEKLGIPVTYYAADISRPLIERGLRNLVPRYKNTKIKLLGLWGTFDDVLNWVPRVSSPKFIMSLGSSLLNNRWNDALAELQQWKSVMQPHDLMLVGIDSEMDHDKIRKSYHPENDSLAELIRAGFSCSNRILECDWYRDENWELTWRLDKEPLMSGFALIAKHEVCTQVGLQFATGDRIECYESIKYTPNEVREQFQLTGLNVKSTWNTPGGGMYEYLVSL
ncbi:hypothetical protein BDW59DRAFT_139507 [Aspergillus cavernicola]|uniref:4-dimethylallyltryptophan N-methyltransferase n=1 Tax=Aspergillus cavernicola TaxID=176166 RepID=A0ABR4IYA1_9EURO